MHALTESLGLPQNFLSTVEVSLTVFHLYGANAESEGNRDSALKADFMDQRFVALFTTTKIHSPRPK